MIMKKSIFSVLLLLCILVFNGCDLLKTNDETTDPSKTMGKVGNYWDLNCTGFTASKITVDSNSDGNVVGSVLYNGKTYQLEGKITDKGVYDYVYSNGDKNKPFTLVKFDAKVGDQWEFKVGTQTVVRKVVHVSTADDTFYGMLMVKTIDVEETIPTGLQVKGAATQFTKILWKFNHKFGFIMATGTKTNGTTVNLYSYSTNAAN
jgi:hypothetical protein